jgi:hypothetical protein
MNDTKWREVLAILNEPGCCVRRILLKFTDRPEVIPSSGRFNPLANIWCDGFPGPFLYREIEWLLFPRKYAVQRDSKGTPALDCEQSYDGMVSQLSKLGKSPIRETSEGLMIVGYE